MSDTISIIVQLERRQSFNPRYGEFARQDFFWEDLDELACIIVQQELERLCPAIVIDVIDPASEESSLLVESPYPISTLFRQQIEQTIRTIADATFARLVTEPTEKISEQLRSHRITDEDEDLADRLYSNAFEIDQHSDADPGL